MLCVVWLRAVAAEFGFAGGAKEGLLVGCAQKFFDGVAGEFGGGRVDEGGLPVMSRP